jgi:sugar/nucleoside kinase (ribokinase family)
LLKGGSLSLRFGGMVGTGGIGHGSFFLLEGNETLGREESRAGAFLDRRDYCKLHIVSHYLRALMGEAFPVFPVGKVGDDDAGGRLLAEMQDAGLDLRFVERVAGAPTLFSFCYLYPDGSGGNLTTGTSACTRVDPAAVSAAEDVMAGLGARGIALAVPEVPLAARAALLELAGRHGLFRAASFTRAEIRAARAAGAFDAVDLLAVNLEEAAAAADLDLAAGSAPTYPADLAPTYPADLAPTYPAGSQPELAERAAAALCRAHPGMRLSITAGAAGSWAGDAHGLVHAPALPVKVEGTAGAGDAHLAGLLAGLSLGLSIAEALPLAALAAAASVSSRHTINPDFSAAVRSLSNGLPAGALRAFLDFPIDRP